VATNKNSGAEKVISGVVVAGEVVSIQEINLCLQLQNS
jgi:hypothetical protein